MAEESKDLGERILFVIRHAKKIEDRRKIGRAILLLKIRDHNQNLVLEWLAKRDAWRHEDVEFYDCILANLRAQEERERTQRLLRLQHLDKAMRAMEDYVEGDRIQSSM